MVWAMMLLLWGLITKIPGRRKKLIILSFITLLIFSNPYLIEKAMVSYQADPVQLSPGQQYKAGILLGGLMSFNTSTKQGFFNISSDRFIQTTRLYQLGHIQKIIISGGNAHDENYSEAAFIRKNFLDIGIPDSNILIEKNSINTIENSRFVKKLADSIHLNDTSLLITSAFHIPRAMELFRKAGVKVKAFPCAYFYVPGQKKFTLKSLVPASYALENWQIFLREWVGRVATRFSR
jgi:uncharacterized SAM-binding protein YcdF (DUF218 family)